MLYNKSVAKEQPVLKYIVLEREEEKDNRRNNIINSTMEICNKIKK